MHTTCTTLRPLTARQAEVLRFYCDRIRRSGVPSFHEVMAHFGFSATNVVADHLRALERKGYVRRPDGWHRARALTVLFDADGERFSSVVPTLPAVLWTERGEAWERVAVDLRPREPREHGVDHRWALVAVHGGVQ